MTIAVKRGRMETNQPKGAVAIRCTKCDKCFELSTDGFKCPHCDGADPRDARIARLQRLVKAHEWNKDADIYHYDLEYGASAAEELEAARKAVDANKDLE